MVLKCPIDCEAAFIVISISENQRMQGSFASFTTAMWFCQKWHLIRLLGTSTMSDETNCLVVTNTWLESASGCLWWVVRPQTPCYYFLHHSRSQIRAYSLSSSEPLRVAPRRAIAGRRELEEDSQPITSRGRQMCLQIEVSVDITLNSQKRHA